MWTRGCVVLEPKSCKLLRDLSSKIIPITMQLTYNMPPSTKLFKIHSFAVQTVSFSYVQDDHQVGSTTWFRNYIGVAWNHHIIHARVEEDPRCRKQCDISCVCTCSIGAM